MKTNMITDCVAVPLMPRRDADASVRVACSSLINLRPGGSGVFGGQLGTVGVPEVYAGTSGCMPLCRMVRNGRPALMSARGRDIVFSDYCCPIKLEDVKKAWLER